METQQLRHFLAIVDAGSFGRAATVLNISQPGLTRSINALEERLGLKLLVRAAKGARPTDAGRTLARHARLILNEHDRAGQAIAAYRGLRRGHVSIGFSSVFNHLIGPDILAALGAERQLDLTIRTGTHEDLAEAVETGALDIAFALFSGERRAGLVYEDNLLLESVVFARADHPLHAMAALDCESLAASPWIVSGNIPIRSVVEEYFRSRGVAPPPLTIAPTSLSLVLATAEAGRHVTVLPRAFEKLTAGRLRPLAAPGNGPLPAGTMAGLISRDPASLSDAGRAVASIARLIVARF